MNGMLEVDVMPIKEFPQPTTSRYLTVNCDRHSNFSSFSSIHLLWNLQTLIFYGCFVQPIVLPSEIWEMSQLRHIKIRPAVLPYPAENEKKHYTILENLDTLSEILDFRFSMGVLKRIPNMKKLRITYFNDSREDWSYYSLYNLVYLSKLESLYLKAKIFSSNIIGLPHSLKKLVLNGCRMPWEDMTVIGSLPNLEVLKLKDDAFEGPEWDLVEGEFVRLKLFSIGSSNLVQWRAEKIHFPCLETLVLEQMHDLEEIPSAKQILEEQLSMGIDDLQLYVTDDVYWRRRYEISPRDSEEEEEEYDIEDALVMIRYLWET
ncbi:hypothetical protein BUALT_Bualt07G0024300 [Buddleja alternifolia]|uniref:Uncharacterized protein n=1 Tax=Buddleja alternifolia TaxID=168488 RepID=A0AAV6XEC1_9LAMI|nr:hypothetical protein BUALT_Bualt07G0024300 [Buddleja alternifolia]